MVHHQAGLVRHAIFYKQVLDPDWQWVEMIRTSPDILSVTKLERLTGVARKLRNRVFVLTTCSMGLSLGDTLALQVGNFKDSILNCHQPSQKSKVSGRFPAALYCPGPHLLEVLGVGRAYEEIEKAYCSLNARASRPVLFPLIEILPVPRLEVIQIAG